MVSTSPLSKLYTIVGVTGHIDHGKTSLVGMLTGIDTDTHPEEKRRGITIDLGFASMTEGDYTFAFVDAPGHQKYVGNLLSGVSSVDIGLLVVACDQGIQEQTLEHAAVLKTLGVPKLIVALSRVDLSDADRRAELTEELEVFLADFGFEEIPVLPVSSITGEGIEALKRELCRSAQSGAGRRTRCFAQGFRMPIDRVLNIPGRGLVVAGTVWSGQVRVGDMLQLTRQSESLRVRELEVHGTMVSESSAGVRTAVNLTGSVNQEVARGDELLACNTYATAPRLLVEVEMYPEVQEVRCPATVQLHTATTSCAARITGAKRLQAGARTVVVVEPERPLVATYGQTCLLRRPYPVGSFGGGRVLAALHPGASKRKGSVEFGERLAVSEPLERLLAWVDYLGELQVPEDWYELQLGVSRDASKGLTQSLIESKKAVLAGERIVSQALLRRTSDYLVKILQQQAQQSDDAWSVVDSVIRRVEHLASTDVIRYAIRELVAEQSIVELNGRLAIASEKTLLSKKQRAKMEQMLAFYAGQRTPPTIKEMATKLSTTVDAATSLARHATQQGILTDLGQGFLVSTDTLKTLVHELKQLLENQPELSVSEIKQGWGVSRKHAIPLLEYCDRHGITRRNQDVRSAGPQLQSLLDGQDAGEKSL